MKHISILAALVAVISLMSAPVADAKSRMDDKKAKDVVQDQAQDMADRAETERDQVKRRDKKNKDRVKDVIDGDSSDDGDDSDHDDADDNSDHGNAGDRAVEGRNDATRGLDNAAGRGNDKSQEMRARRDERKAIKEEYKANGKGATVDVDGAADSLETVTDEDMEDTEKKEKKPWWKFWNQ